MKWPWKTKPSAFEAEYDAVKALPEPEREPRAEVSNWTDPPSYSESEAPINPPIDRVNRQTPWARPPMIDKFPVILGQNLTGQSLSSAMRLCNSGFRYQYVDLIDELLENDPDTRAVVRARVIGVACGRYEVQPAKLPESASEAERDIAKQIADDYSLDFYNIPCLAQRLQQLAWADIYGVSGHEIIWEHPKADRWEPIDWAFIHSRRLNYMNPTSWDLYVYDQGLVGPGSDYMGPTVGVYGLPIAKYPGKFIVHTPSLSGQYPTRDGEARYIAFYMLLKRMVVRCSAQDFERVIRPWVIGYFNRQMLEGQTAPFADKADIAALNDSLDAFGTGSMNWAALPNSVKVELLRAVSALSVTDFLGFLNRAIAKSLLGQAFTTEPGPNGNMATAEVADKNTTKILVYSSGTLCDTLRRDFAMPWMRLNRPALSRHFCPRHVANVEDLPSPAELVKMAKDMAMMDAPVDLRDLSQRTTVKLADSNDPDALRSRMISPQYGPNPAESGEPVNTAIANKSAVSDAKPQLAEVKNLHPKSNSAPTGAASPKAENKD
jgi:hypothetical protein